MGILADKEIKRNHVNGTLTLIVHIIYKGREGGRRRDEEEERKRGGRKRGSGRKAGVRRESGS